VEKAQISPLVMVIPCSEGGCESVPGCWHSGVGVGVGVGKKYNVEPSEFQLTEPRFLELQPL
jgi:hypothetical protein